MAGLPPYSAAQWDAMLATLYAAACQRAGVPVATLGEGGQANSFFYALRAALMTEDQQRGYAVLISRLATCSGADCDAFVASFGMTRLLATYASGQVLCTTNSVIVVPIVVPVGAQFGTQSGLIYTVIADPSNEAYSQAQGGYVITPSGGSAASSVSATVQCTIPGTIGNAQPNQITINLPGTISAIGIGTVTNPATVAGAIDVESDPQLRARFAAKFAGGQDLGSPLSILGQVLGLEANLTASVVDLNNDGTAEDGWFTVVVNVLGATSTTPEQLRESVAAAVLAIHSAGASFVVVVSTVVPINITAHLTLASGADTVATPQLAVAALTAYINSIGLDPMGAPTTLSIAKVYRAIMDASTDIVDVTGLTVNGGTVEVTANFAQQFSVGSIVFD